MVSNFDEKLKMFRDPNSEAGLVFATLIEFVNAWSAGRDAVFHCEIKDQQATMRFETSLGSPWPKKERRKKSLAKIKRDNERSRKHHEKLGKMRDASNENEEEKGNEGLSSKAEEHLDIPSEDTVDGQGKRKRDLSVSNSSINLSGNISGKKIKRIKECSKDICFGQHDEEECQVSEILGIIVLENSEIEDLKSLEVQNLEGLERKDLENLGSSWRDLGLESSQSLQRIEILDQLKSQGIDPVSLKGPECLLKSWRFEGSRAPWKGCCQPVLE